MICDSLFNGELMDATLNGTAGRSADAERWVLVATILATSMAFIDTTALNVALPAIQTGLAATGPQLLWIINSYLLILAALILVGGSLGDRLGRKKVFAAGIAIFMAGSLACGLAPSIVFLIAARVLEGLGGALMIPGSLAIINATVVENRRGRAIGTWSSVTTLVTIIGPALGGLLAGAGLWRWVFLINIPLGVVSLAILTTRVPETRGNEGGHIDWPGAALIALALAGLTYGFISAPGLGFANPSVFLPLGVGLLFLVLFLVVERLSPSPMMPLPLFRSTTFSGANLLTLFLYGALNANSFFLSLDLIQTQGYPESLAGLSFLPFALTLAALSRWAGRQADLLGPRRLLILGPALVGVGFFVLSLAGLTAGPSAYWTTFFPGILIFGVGMGLTVSPLTATVLGAVDSQYSGTASGINNAVARTAGVLAIAILGAVALFHFQAQLAQQTATLGLSDQAASALRSGAAQLGALQAPAGLSPAVTSAVNQAIDRAFVKTVNTVLLIDAGLAWLSALVSVWLIRKKTNEQLQSSGE